MDFYYSNSANLDPYPVRPFRLEVFVLLVILKEDIYTRYKCKDTKLLELVLVAYMT